MAGMQGFVKGRNADTRTGSPQPDLSYLKTEVPNTKSDRKRKSKQSNSIRRENDPSARQHRPQQSTSTRSSTSGGDDLSTTASTSRQRNGRDNLETRTHTYDKHGIKSEHHAAIFDDMDYYQSLENEPDLPQADLNMENVFNALQAEARGNAGSPTIAETQIKGDSYPPTTVGAPSVSEHDQYEARASAGVGNMASHANRNHFRPQFYKQVPPSGVSRHQLESAAQAQGKSAAPQHQLESKQPKVREPKSDFDASAGFSFGPAPPPVKKDIAVHTSHPQSQAVEQRPVVAEITRSDHHGGPSIFAPTERQHVKSRRPEHVAEGRLYEGRRRVPVIQHSVTEHGPHSDSVSDEDPGEQLAHPGHEGHQERSLDYEPPELYDKDYQSLRAEPFDHRPGAQPFTVPDISESAPIGDKLAQLACTGQETQARFFASLNIDEWEEAGDWFLDRFGENIRQLKDVRREKRKAARAFEDEVEQREMAVSKKRELTHAAMNGMKASGAAVLLGTPGKKK